MNFEPYPDNQVLIGPNAPNLDQIDDLIRYLVTIRHRFGNTAVTFDGKCTWGANALWVKDSQRGEIAALKERIAEFLKDGLVAIAGAVCTPEAGYVADGGLPGFLADVKSLRKQHDRYLTQRSTQCTRELS